MKKLILASAIAAAFTGSVAQAEEATPEHSVSYNVGVTTDYRYRGISQSRKQPAISLGADYTHNPSGFYAGFWSSTIKWTKDTKDTNNAFGSGDIEIDLYAGRKGEVAKNTTYDVGVLVYTYPNNRLGRLSGFVDATTAEVYGQIGYGPAYLKYSHAVTNTFGNLNSEGSYYIDAGFNPEIGEKLVLNLHAGRQVIKNGPIYNYNDWKVGLTKDFGAFAGSVAYIGTDAGADGYTLGRGSFNGSRTAVVSITKTF